MKLLIVDDEPDVRALVHDAFVDERPGCRLLEAKDGEEGLRLIAAERPGEGDRVRGLELSADDDVVKPFSPLELVARVDTVLWRARPTIQSLVERGGREVRLTRTEFDLLAELASRAGQALTRESPLRNVWGAACHHETHSLKVYVGRLREKLERDPWRPHLILTVRGVGHRFAPPEAAH